MPIYEYQCAQCGERTEALQRVDEAPLTVCPRCGGALRKLVSAPAFQFKGSGWYVTDYAGKKSGASAGAEGEAKPAEAAETKPAAKGDAETKADKPAAAPKKPAS